MAGPSYAGGSGLVSYRGWCGFVHKASRVFAANCETRSCWYVDLVVAVIGVLLVCGVVHFTEKYLSLISGRMSDLCFCFTLYSTIILIPGQEVPWLCPAVQLADGVMEDYAHALPRASESVDLMLGYTMEFHLSQLHLYLWEERQRNSKMLSRMLYSATRGIDKIGWLWSPSFCATSHFKLFVFRPHFRKGSRLARSCSSTFSIGVEEFLIV